MLTENWWPHGNTNNEGIAIDNLLSALHLNKITTSFRLDFLLFYQNRNLSRQMETCKCESCSQKDDK